MINNGFVQNIITLVQWIAAPAHNEKYFSLMGILFLIALSGVILVCELINNPQSKIKLVGRGMIAGMLSYILYLSIFSYIFKGKLAIQLLSLAYLSVFLGVLIIRRRKYLSLLSITWTKAKIAIAIGIALHGMLIFLYAGNIPLGGDAMTPWAISNSFARGNYPTVLPWQPDFLTIYHQGAFIAQGAIHAITNVDVTIIHFFFATYVVSGLFCLIIAIAWDHKKSILAIFPAFATVFLFGPFILISNPLDLLNDLKQLVPFTPQNINQHQSVFIQFPHFAHAYGGGASSLYTLLYGNYIALGYAALILWLDILISGCNKNKFWHRHITLITIQCITLSIDITFFLPQITIYAIFFIYEVKKNKVPSPVIKAGIIAVIMLILFFTLQNPIRDGLFVPKPSPARFRILNPNEAAAKERIEYLSGKTYTDKKISRTTWYSPNALIFALILLRVGIYLRAPWIWITSSVAVINIGLGLIVVSTYWVQNAMRFINYAYAIEMLACALLVIELSQRKTKRRFIGTEILIILIPSIIVTYLYHLNGAFNDTYPNITNAMEYKNTTLDWIDKNIPHKKRILFVDEYPHVQRFSQITFEAFSHYGMFIPVSPPDYKVMNVDIGGDWFDAVTFLSPQSIKKLQVEYIYINDIAISRFDSETVKNIQQERYFKKIHADSQGKLYKISNEYKKSPEPQQTLANVYQSIPKGSSVYIDTTERAEIRKELIMRLSDSHTLFGPAFIVGQDYYMYIEKAVKFYPTQPGKRLDAIEYALLKPETNPSDVLEGKYDKVIPLQFVVLWKKQ